MGEPALNRAAPRGPDIQPAHPVHFDLLDPDAPPRGRGIHAKIAWVTGQLLPVELDGRNEHNDYRYPTSGNIIATVQPLLVRAGIAVVPSCVSVKVRAADPAKPGRGLSRVVMEYRLVDVDDPTQITVARVPGMAEDLKGDKSLGKALTLAHAAALKETFQIISKKQEQFSAAHRADLDGIRRFGQRGENVAGEVDGEYVDNLGAYARDRWERAKADARFAHALALQLEAALAAPAPKPVQEPRPVAAAAPAAEGGGGRSAPPAKTDAHASALAELRAAHPNLPQGVRAIVSGAEVPDMKRWLRAAGEQLASNEALAVEAALALRRATLALEIRKTLPAPTGGPARGKTLTEARQRSLEARAREGGFTTDTLAEMLLERFGLRSPAEITNALYEEATAYAGDRNLARLYSATRGTSPADRARRGVR